MADKTIFVDWNDCSIMVGCSHRWCYRVLPTGIDTAEIDLETADLILNYPQRLEAEATAMAQRKVAQ